MKEMCYPPELGLAQFDNRGKEALEELLETGHQGPIFIGSAMTNRNSWRVDTGAMCYLSPIPDG